MNSMFHLMSFKDFKKPCSFIDDDIDEDQSLVISVTIFTAVWIRHLNNYRKQLWNQTYMLLRFLH